MDKAQYRKLMDWMKNDRHLQDWWEGEFVKSDAEIDVALRNKMFVRIKEETVGKSRSARVVRMNILRWAAMICLPVCLAFFTYYLIDMSQAPGMPLVVKAGKGDKARIELPDGKKAFDKDYLGRKRKKRGNLPGAIEFKGDSRVRVKVYDTWN